MWQPDPSWRELGVGRGPATAGLWLADHHGGSAVVKRLRRPQIGDPDSLSDPRRTGYWRREAELALAPEVANGPGLTPAEFLRVDEDDEGITIWSAECPGPPPAADAVAQALGRFGAAPAADVPWAARDALPERIAMAEERGGWPTLARTPFADLADRLWRRRHHWLDALAAGRAGRVHGDATPGNFVAIREAPQRTVIAVDWQGFGIDVLGSDLGYYALSVREDFDSLLGAFLAGASEIATDLDPGHIAQAARVVGSYTALARAEWALSRIAPGEGALAGKLNHPSVLPYLRGLRRLEPQLATLAAG